MPAHRRIPLISHGRLKRQNPFLNFLKFLGVAVLVFAVAGGSVAAIGLFSLQHKINSTAVELDSKPAEEPEPSIIPTVGAFTSGANILLVGSDSGEGNPAYGERDGAALNDVTILIHLNEGNTGISVISFPRDTFVTIPDCTNPETGEVTSATSETKINQAFGRGGLACVASTVELLTGASIPYAAVIEFDGVIEMSNAVGGVTVCVSGDINDDYTGTHLAAGEHTLQGADALAFLRTRHGVGDGSDLGRISNQQVFLSALMRTIKSDETLGDINKLYGLANATLNSVVVSNSLAQLPTLVSFILAAKEVPLDRIAFLQYPTAVGWSGDQSGVYPLSDAAYSMMSAVLSDQPIAITGGTAPGEIGSIIVGTVPPEDPATTPSPSPTTPADPQTPVSLPSDVTGSTADQITCSQAN